MMKSKNMIVRSNSLLSTQTYRRKSCWWSCCCGPSAEGHHSDSQSHRQRHQQQPSARRSSSSNNNKIKCLRKFSMAVSFSILLLGYVALNFYAVQQHGRVLQQADGHLVFREAGFDDNKINASHIGPYHLPHSRNLIPVSNLVNYETHARAMPLRAAPAANRSAATTEQQQQQQEQQKRQQGRAARKKRQEMIQQQKEEDAHGAAGHGHMKPLSHAKPRGAAYHGDHTTTARSKDKSGANKQQKRRSSPRSRPSNKDMHKPRPESLLPNATFSACLLIRDDNEILSEWLAYHYHVLNMRQLIVAVDPLSQDSPSQILLKWRLATNLDIAEWTDADYMPADFLTTGQAPEEYLQKKEDFPDPDALAEVSNHRYRQRVFLAKCMRTFRAQGHSWVLHVDTDEFVVASKLLRQMKPKYLTIPAMSQPNAVLSLLQQTVLKTSQQVNYPCMSMLRVLFGSVESAREEIEQGVPTDHFNASTFETLRWRYHALPHNMTLHGNPKVLLDVAAIPKHFFEEDVVFSIHRPVKQYCHVNTELEFTHFRHQPIAVNHYLGTWERYAARNDKRRSREKYNGKASVQRGHDDGVRLWLEGFVENIGLSTAETLLGSQYLNEEDRDAMLAKDY